MTEWQKEWQIERKGELSDMERKEWEGEEGVQGGGIK